MSSFNPDLIRQYMAGTEVLAHGIDYYICENGTRTEEEAAELAYAFALKYCRKWYRRDRKDPQTRHRRAYDSFAQRVQDAQYFNSSRRQKAAEAEMEAKRAAEANEAHLRCEEEEKQKAEKLRLRQLENERKRVAALREKCVAQGLDFEKENIRQLRRRRARERFFSVLTVLFGIPSVLSFLLIILWFILFGWADGSSGPFDGIIAIVVITWLVTGGLSALAMRSERKNLPKEAYAPLEEHKKAKKKARK